MATPTPKLKTATLAGDVALPDAAAEARYVPAYSPRPGRSVNDVVKELGGRALGVRDRNYADVFAAVVDAGAGRVYVAK